MALYKFEDLLKREQLYFRRIDKFKDENEGRKTIPSRGLLPEKASEFQKHQQLVEKWEQIDEDGLKHHFVCCWNENGSEDLNLWNEYGEQDEAIAILTDEDRLHKCVKKVFVEFGRPDYTKDYAKDYNHNSNPNKRCFQKDLSYKPEKELRAHFFDNTPNSSIDYNHFYIDVNLEILVKEIIISPYAPSSFVNSVSASIKKYKREYLIERIKNSDLKPLPKKTE